MGSVKDLVVLEKPGELRMGRGELHFSNRYSVFDWGEMPDHLKNKGVALCTTSAYFFEQLAEDVPTHYQGVVVDGKLYGSIDDVPKPPETMRIGLARVIKPELKRNVDWSDQHGHYYDYSNVEHCAKFN